MDAALIRQAVPNPHPDFVRSLAHFDPPTDIVPELRRYLPGLHKLFLKKRAAIERGSWVEWDDILKKEAELVARAAASV